ncbi:MAG: hypothetical protein IAF58_21175 [Leptolyngbya sp.]|nr:hypothetical protein [Candidatus Melainabacteria bacterium]
MKKKRAAIPYLISLISLASGLSYSAAYADKENTPQRKDDDNKQSLLKELAEKSSMVHSWDKNNPEFDNRERELSKILEQLETRENLTEKEEYLVGMTLNRLALLHFPAPSRRRPGPVISDLDREKGKAFKKREISFHTRLHKIQSYQVRCHQALLNWYNDRRCTAEADEQTKIISKLLGTTDPNLINPRRHSACGSPIEDDLNSVTKQLPVYIKCGMG